MFLAAGITIFCAAGIYGKSGGSLRFVIEGKSGSWVYPINRTEHIDIPGPLGSTTVVLEGGQARVAASPCVNQSCVGGGSIGRKGEWIACLPNAVMVRVEASGGRAFSGGKETNHAELDGAVW
jgi:hypothetical protein